MGDRLLSSPAEGEPPGLASVTISGRERQYNIDDSGTEMLESLGKTAEGFKTAKARITYVAEQVIKYYGSIKTDDLVALMDMAGVAVGGKDKCQMVSALLGRDQRFSNSRQDGWRLAKANR